MMKFYVTDFLTNDEKKKYEKLGLFCYDLRGSDDGSEIANIERRVIINNVGAIITNKEINFNSHSFVDYNIFTSNNKCVSSISELLNKGKNRER